MRAPPKHSTLHSFFPAAAFWMVGNAERSWKRDTNPPAAPALLTPRRRFFEKLLIPVNLKERLLQPLVAKRTRLGSSPVGKFRPTAQHITRGTLASAQTLMWRGRFFRKTARKTVPG